MKLHERIAIVAAVASLAGVVVFSRRLGESERKAMEAGEDLARTSQDLRKKINEAEGRADEAARKLLMIRQEAETLPVAQVEAPPSTPPAQDPVPVAPTGVPETIVEGPATFAAMKSAAAKSTRAYIEDINGYRDLLISWGLTGETLEKAVNALLDRALVDRKYLPPESRQAIDETLARIFTPQQLAALAQHEQALPDREMQRRVDLQVSGWRIDPARAPAVRDILIEENRREAAAPLQGPLNSEEQMVTLLAAKRESNDRILQRARPLLTDPEYEKLRRWTEMSIQPYEVNLANMRAAKQGAEAR